MNLTRIVEGPVAPIGVLSVDGRRIKAGSLSARLAGDGEPVSLDEGPVEVLLPLMGLDHPADGHEGAEVIGRVTRAWIGEDDWVHVEGEADDSVKPGKYGCGVDLSEVTFRLSWADNPDKVVTEDALRNDTHRQLVQEAEKGLLIALTLYLDRPSARPAFEGAGVTVR